MLFVKRPVVAERSAEPQLTAPVGAGAGNRIPEGFFESAISAITKNRAAVLRAANHIRVQEVDRLWAEPGEALLRITLTTICGTDFPAICLLVPVIPLLGG